MEHMKYGKWEEWLVSGLEEMELEGMYKQNI
jgi:hypothetical protein